MSSRFLSNPQCLFLFVFLLICAVFISKPEFSSQTKEKLVVNKKYFEELMSLFSKRFTKYLEENILISLKIYIRRYIYILTAHFLPKKHIRRLNPRILELGKLLEVCP